MNVCPGSLEEGKKDSFYGKILSYSFRNCSLKILVAASVKEAATRSMFSEIVGPCSYIKILSI